jgi:hypothetical protein
MAMAMKDLVLCGDHQWAPASVVCVHLARGESREWIKVLGVPGCDDDWLCPACWDRIDEIGVDDVVTLCMHCSRQLREEAA